MHRHQLGAVGKGGFHLDFRDHLRNAFHDVGAGEDGRALAHQFGDALAVARTFQNGAGDQRDGFRVVELQTARQAPFGEQAGGEDEQLVLLAGGEFHGFS
jgi:hypothetical protein